MEKREPKSWKKHKKIALGKSAEKGEEREPTSINISPISGAGGSRAAALYSRTAHSPAQNPKIVAEHEKGKVLAQTKERVRAEKVRDEKVL